MAVEFYSHFKASVMKKRLKILALTTVRVTTHLESLEKSGNSKVVRENGKREKSG